MSALSILLVLWLAPAAIIIACLAWVALRSRRAQPASQAPERAPAVESADQPPPLSANHVSLDDEDESRPALPQLSRL